MPAILVIILGGYDPDGGSGNLYGVLVALLLLQTLQTGFNLFGFNPYVKNLVWGLMVLGIMVINQLSQKFKRKTKYIRVRA